MFDTHMHTDPFSTDSKMKLDELLRKNIFWIMVPIGTHPCYLE